MMCGSPLVACWENGVGGSDVTWIDMSPGEDAIVSGGCNGVVCLYTNEGLGREMNFLQRF